MRIFLASLIFFATLAYAVAPSAEGSEEIQKETQQTSTEVAIGPRTSASAELPNAEFEFNNWVAQNGKEYFTKSDRVQALSNFALNKATIGANNVKVGQTFLMGHNSFSDWSDAQFNSVLIDFSTLKTSVSSVQNYSPNPSISAPGSFNYIGSLQPIQDQDTCASSFAYASVAALEGFLKKKFNMSKKLSEQHIIDCSGNGNGCNGGTYEQFIEYVKQYGIMSAASYDAMSGNKCSKAKQRSTLRNVTINGYRQIYNDELALKNALVNVGPTVACVDASGWRFYSSGIYSDSNESSTKKPCNHYVTCVGYGKGAGNPYYLFRNSWGKNSSHVLRESHFD